ncbi:SKI-like proto-oncogene b isoform X1 [Alosa sapidissima]|uniref:SKI-like proto-oncogene b isoform X1 n=1 Tax=Alosa sapidissima TaxID=34773 RepID=UPI001C08A3DA|nr:SKI-like proto-oncogene b isoform X1 [Alosa sapidissima]XP_041924856.1 SKI-like proto-oncogene b isoform X1 [Alosa sapidissima]
MASLQAELLHLHKGQVPFKGSMKRHSRERPPEATPIKKRIMASMSPKSRKTSDCFLKTTNIKKERVEEEVMEHHPVMSSGHVLGYTHFPLIKNGGALDLSPGLRNTLAQFTLSSQCSLGGPATFSGHYGHTKATPHPSLGSAATAPLLVPPDSSTELTLCSLEGEPISCFSVGGEWRLCLPQVLNTVLRDFSLQQINAVCDQLYVYCSRCDAAQLHVLKVMGVLPAGAPSCGLITLTDAQRLCNALLHPGDAAPRDQDESEKEGKDGGGFWVEHQCLGKCQGLFVPRLYTAVDVPCIRCAQCRVLFSPKRFVMHSHRRPDKRTCHWGFDSDKWACYLQLGRKHLGTPDEVKYKQLLEKMKEKFSNIQQLEKKTLSIEGAKPKTELDLGSMREEPGETDADGKAAPPLVFALDSHLYPHMKGNQSHLDIMQHSFLLYMQNKLHGLNPALIPEFGLVKEGGLLNVDMLRALLNPENKQHSLDEKGSARRMPATPELLPSSGPVVQSQRGCPDKEPAESVSIETQLRGKSVGGGVGEEDSRDGMVMEVLQLYTAQQQKLQTTLHKQKQLEKELEVLRQGEVAEAALTEHALRQREAPQEQSRLETLCQHTSSHRADGGELPPDSHYAAELLELRRRLDRAEEDREELQEELRREREAREKLERTIAELKQQMKGSSGPATPDMPLLTPPSNDPQTPRTP